MHITNEEDVNIYYEIKTVVKDSMRFQDVSKADVFISVCILEIILIGLRDTSEVVVTNIITYCIHVGISNLRGLGENTYIQVPIHRDIRDIPIVIVSLITNRDIRVYVLIRRDENSFETNAVVGVKEKNENSISTTIKANKVFSVVGRNENIETANRNNKNSQGRLAFYGIEILKEKSSP